jgi:maltooligosyltrehalose trehalohydrolase
MHTSLGALLLGDSARFRVWAPNCLSLELELEGDGAAQRLPMSRTADGFFEREVQPLKAGTRYRYRLPHANQPRSTARPDPVSRFQPEGVHGWSQVVDRHSFEWHDQQWQGIPKQQLVIYELHIGTFTDEGTYAAAVQRLGELVELGVTAVELMPIAESAGKWNWGYDGVHFFAPRHTYGTPDDLRRFVDAAHNHGLAVILDVVYNHFGPEGNYLAEFGPYVSQKHRTAWGGAPNFDSEDEAEARHIRNFFLANATYWIDEFHFDGLRVDAIHCMADDSRKHIVTEIGEAIDKMRAECGRELHLIAESNIHDPEMIGGLDSGGHGYDAQWCDDFLHSVFAVLRPGERMSHREYHPQDLHATLHRGYVFERGLTMPQRRVECEEHTPAPVADLQSLVFSIQNHDFIGNHPLAKRLHQLTAPATQRAAAALLLLYPAIPMLFMGEEFACDQPFHFFVDYTDAQLRTAVERGRRAEYPQHDWSAGASPLAASAFTASKLSPATAGDQVTLAWYRALIAIRKEWQELGLMQTHTMRAEWNANRGYASIAYHRDDESRFVIVRLSGGDGAECPPLRLEVHGEVTLSQSCTPVTDKRNLFMLEAQAVAIGSGDAAIEV